MSALMTLKAAALNITTEPPHTPGRYVEIFNFIRQMESPPSGAIAGSDRLMLNYFGQDKNTLIGTFARYTHIAPNSPWWDTENRQAILDVEGNPVPQTREGIGPNLRDVSFIFYIDSHLFTIDCRNISPNQFAKGLNIIFAHEAIASQFGPITVTVVPTSDALERLITLPNKRRIEIVFTLPNGEVPDEEESILQRYKSMNAGRAQEIVTGQAEHSLEPDAELKTKMKISQINGYTTVDYIQSNGKLDRKSTKDFPNFLKERHLRERYWDTLKHLGERFVAGIRENL